MEGKPKILCIGEEWKGSNSSGLFYALSRIGCITNIVNELRYISLAATAFQAKLFNRAIRPFQIVDFNYRLMSETTVFQPDLVLVYKGAFVKPETIVYWKNLGIPVVNFFPDVSFMAHGNFIPDCLIHYDHIFTTKSFGADDLKLNFEIGNHKISFIPHGFDPMVHRIIKQDGVEKFACDASFIGGYTPHKYDYLSQLAERSPGISLKIWGNGWRDKCQGTIGKSIQGLPIMGDLYALGINSSRINIALLSEQVKGASSGDNITSRTFHIPGSGGFMLHERTDEVLQYFEENEEVACFSSAGEMIEKVDFYLNHESERLRIQKKGYEKALNAYSLDNTAQMLLSVLTKRGLI
ncbi:MAG: glycosyltransferase [Cyclobacteriaceae bacterium]|nr:glycosyltransferase [Cyclobacteriaceae bacterium]MCB0505673.1 glycosyltransferase [Cyclobacteriaceae bacterium]MCB9236643.1 glycosyltransferase [Flammeovirgaceae bacterium]